MDGIRVDDLLKEYSRPRYEIETYEFAAIQQVWCPLSSHAATEPTYLHNSTRQGAAVTNIHPVGKMNMSVPTLWSNVLGTDQLIASAMIAVKGPPVQREPLKHRDHEVDLDCCLGKTQVAKL
ncbi:hypothetical protein Tco_1009508 [Tanacetum coccineum]